MNSRATSTVARYDSWSLACDRIPRMSKTEILSELPKLSADERFEIRVKLAELDGDRWLDDDDPLTDEQKALLDARLAVNE